MSSVPYTGGSGWSYPIIREPFPGAWQQNVSINRDNAASFHADFACKTLIARDIAKLRVKLVEQDANDIWAEITNPAFSPVLREPNSYQTRNQFWESWLLSKLSRGNTYVLKVRDARNVVTDLHVLDPTRVQPLVSTDGTRVLSLEHRLPRRHSRDHGARARDHSRSLQLPVSSAGRHPADIRQRPCLDARP